MENEESNMDDIAIVGVGCNFPGGEGLENFWQVLVSGRTCSAEVPETRFDPARWHDHDDAVPGKTQTTKAAFIDGFNEFDHRFFGVPEAEANYMDPQQKVLLQCSYRALEDSGIPLEKISGSRTGVYIGLMNRDYETLLNNSASTITHYNGTGTAMSIAANRISYTFNLTGPSLAIDSACSSSLVALHAACQAIRHGDCEMALCGGVSCIIEPRVFVALSKAKMISPEGTSKPFSKRADGYGRGEGCGIVVLKPLKQALRDYNPVWGVVCKTAVNQDGHTVSPITKPSMVQQEELLKQIYSTGNFLSDIQYVEAHGTGTPVGDATEAGSISKVIAKARSAEAGPLCIGSVKGNIGHTESAAGVAGLIKVLLMMRHGTIVPSVFYSEESSSVDSCRLNLKIPTEVRKWTRTGSTRRTAGVNSFGFGGTNAHVVVREYSPPAPSSPETFGSRTFGSRTLFALSAATSRSLQMCIADTYGRIRTDRKADLKTLLYTSACRRSHTKHKYRKVFAAGTLSDLEEQLKYEITAHRPVAFKPDPGVVFVFCGNGVTYRGMCQQLLEEEPVFRAKVQEVEECLKKYRSTRILQKIANGLDEDDLFKPDVVQPVLFATQVALAYLLKHWGVRPAAVVGHSVGEVAAACCSGLLSLEDAVKVIHHRSVLQAKVTGGRMLVVANVPITRVLDILPSYAGKVCLAALNSPLSCVLSGERDAVESVYQRLEHSFKGENLFLHVLKVPAAYHSHMMDPILNQIRECVGFLRRRDPECDLFSSVTGKACGLEDFVSGDYWAKNIRDPVAFEEVVKEIAGSKRNLIFIEIGPRKALQRNIMETLGEDTVVLPAVQPNRDLESVLNAVSRLFEMGVNVDWDQFYKGFEAPPASYPVYQFDCFKNDVFFEEIRQGNETTARSSHPFIRSGNGATYTCCLSSEKDPYFWEHRNSGTAIAPGSLFVELALASVKEAVVPKEPVSHFKLSINFQNLLILCKNSHDLRVQLEMSKSEVLFQIQSSSAVHAIGTVSYGSQPSVVQHQNIMLDAIFQRCSSVMPRELVYATLNQAGFDYGPTFQQLGEVRYGEEFKEAVGTVRIPKELGHQLYEFCLHPVVLDYFLQMTAVLILSADASRHGFPSGIGSLVVTAPLSRVVVMYMKVTQEMPEYFEVCGCLTDEQGHTLVELKDVRLTFLEKKVDSDLFFHNERIAAHAGTRISSKPRAVVLEDTLGIASALKPYFDPSSVFLSPTEVPSQISDLLLQADRSEAGIEKTVLIWSSNLNHLGTQSVLRRLVDICDFYRQVVLTLRKCKRLQTLLVVTYRSSERVVDHISPGFVLSGMTRACAAESSELSFQLIDLATVSREDIEMLVDVICTCRPQEYPEITICKGQVQSTVITRTPVNGTTEVAMSSSWAECLTLQTAGPYAMVGLSAVPSSEFSKLNKATDVEVQVCKICVHSEDYFPVSVSSLKYAQTLYWNRQNSQNHGLVALDFSGTVTAVGKDVHRLKVGDHIVACYPTLATSKVILPERACYKTNRLWVLRDVPCVSYFILSWEILCKTLSKTKQTKTMGIFSSVPDSGLVKVFTFTATRWGWNVLTQTDHSALQKQCSVYVFIPPYEQTWPLSLASDGCERQIVVVCGNQSALRPSSVLPNDRGNLCFHFLTMENILQKYNLKARRCQVDRWLKQMQTDRPSLALSSRTFQATAKETDTAGSYFGARTLPLIVLENFGSVVHPSHVRLQPSARRLFSKKGVYIVSGGLSGLGFETVKFMSHWGAKHIATLSRRFPSQETQEQIQSLKKRYGVMILSLQCDVSLSDQVLEALASIGRRFPSCPVKGVFHSAAVLHDGLLHTLHKSAFEEVLRPKVSGALNLHYATLNSNLDYFVCYSSISSFIGNASQANYAAANSFLDALCQYRRNVGLAGQSINWGPLKLGLLLDKDDFQKFLESKGMLTMEVPEIHKALKRCLLENKVQQAVCKFNFRNLSNNVLSQNASLKARLTALVRRELESRVIGQPRRNLPNSGEECVRGIIGAICNVDPEELGGDTVLSQVGMDSMLAMTLQNRIFQDTGISVPLVTLLDPNTTINSLMMLLQEHKDGECEM